MSDNEKINDSVNDNAYLNESIGREDAPTEVFETERVSFRETMVNEPVPTVAAPNTAAPQTQAKVDKPVSRKMGLASFVISIVGASVALLALILAVVALVGGPGGHRDGGRGSHGMGSGSSSPTELGDIGSRSEGRGMGSIPDIDVREQVDSPSGRAPGVNSERATQQSGTDRA